MQNPAKKHMQPSPAEQPFSADGLEELLTSFQIATGLAVSVCDADNVPLFTIGGQAAYCAEVTRILQDDAPCRQEVARAARESSLMGTACLYTCHAGLCCIAFPIVIRAKQYGVVIAGPFLIEYPDDALIQTLLKRHHLPADTANTLPACAASLPVVTPEQVTGLSNLLSYLVGCYLEGSGELIHAGHSRILQQTKLSESIRNYKNLTPEELERYPVTLENTVIARARRADTTGTRMALNELFAYLLLHENYDLHKLKSRLIELCSLLSRAALDREANANTGTILDMNEQLINELIASDDYNEMCYILSENIEVFTEQVLQSDRHHAAVTRAIEYLAKHYSEPVTLTDIAGLAGMHPAYFSGLFRRVTGLTFKDYLTKIRIEHALQLLANTDYPIMDIAISCGFSDQSYFTKVFRKQTGMTPRQFR